MIAALSETDAHIVLSALCKANQRNGRKDKNDETSQIRGMKGTLVGKIWSPRPTSAEQF